MAQNDGNINKSIAKMYQCVQPPQRVLSLPSMGNSTKWSHTFFRVLQRLRNMKSNNILSYLNFHCHSKLKHLVTSTTEQLPVFMEFSDKDIFLQPNKQTAKEGFYNKALLCQIDHNHTSTMWLQCLLKGVNGCFPLLFSTISHCMSAVK